MAEPSRQPKLENHVKVQRGKIRAVLMEPKDKSVDELTLSKYHQDPITTIDSRQYIDPTAPGSLEIVIAEFPASRSQKPRANNCTCL